MLLAYYYFAHFAILLAEGANPAAPATGANPAKPPGGGTLTDFIFGNPIIPLVLTFVVFYLFIIRSDMKKQREQKQTLAELKKNDVVVTIGGVCGTIVNIQPDSRYVTIRIDDSNNTRMRILRSAISGVDSGDEPAEKIEKKDEK